MAASMSDSCRGPDRPLERFPASPPWRADDAVGGFVDSLIDSPLSPANDDKATVRDGGLWAEWREARRGFPELLGAQVVAHSDAPTRDDLLTPTPHRPNQPASPGSAPR